MKFFKAIVILVLLTTFLNAEYLRSIRIGSFKTKENANRELSTLKNFIQDYKKVKSLEKKSNFKFITRKSGTYYVTVVEPFNNKNILQEVLDTIRIRYPETYVTRLPKDYEAPNVKKTSTKKVIQKKPEIKKVPKEIIAPVTDKRVKEVLVEVKEILEKTDIVENNITNKQAIVTEVNKTKEEPIVKKSEQTIEDKETEVKKERGTNEVKKVIEKKETKIIEKEKVPKKEVEVVAKRDKHKEAAEVYKILCTVAIIFILILLILLSKSKRLNRKYIEKEEETLQKLNKVYTEIKDKEGYLDKSKVSMNSIISFTNLLLEFDMTTIQKDYVRRILSTSGNLLNTINNTLDLNKIITGQLKIENEYFDLNRVIHDVTNVVSIEAKTNRLRIIIDMEDDVPVFLLGDPLRLKQVLINLVSNSARFTQDGDLFIHVKKLYSYVNAVTIGFKISDTGTGITDEQAQEILRADSQDIKSTDLIVSKKLIEMMNGEIKIYNSPDMGTTFTFHIKFNTKKQQKIN